MVHFKQKHQGGKLIGFCSLAIILPGLAQGTIIPASGKITQSPADIASAGMTGSAAEERIEQEVSTLDEATRKNLVTTMLGKIEKNKSATVPAVSPAEPGAGSPVAGLANTSEEQKIEQEISTLNETDRNNLVKTMLEKVGGKNTAPNPGRRRIESGVVESVNKSTPPLITISEFKNDDILINVGDTVCFNTPKTGVLRPEDRFLLYKSFEKNLSGTAKPPFAWLERVGKIKILESNKQISIGRVIAMHDIILNGDSVFLCQQP